MKPSDKEKIKTALFEIRKFKWLEDGKCGSEFKRGMASVAEVMLDIISNHGNSFEYQSAVSTIAQRSKNNGKFPMSPPLPPSNG